MAETKRIAEEAIRTGGEYQEQAERAGQAVHEQTERLRQEFQRAAQTGFETVSRSFSEAQRGIRAIAGEMTGLSKKSFEDVFQAWDELFRARSFEEMFDIQTQYVRKAHDTYVSEMSKLGELYLDTTRNASKALEQTARSRS